MNNQSDTQTQLIEAARNLFARHGFAGTSIRAITEAAGANLGAVTYHFGSKEALYEVVCTSLAVPMREQITRAAAEPGPALDRIERAVRALFAYLRDHPELPRVVMHQLASDRPIPEPAKQALMTNHGTLSALIAQGQREGTVRSGDPRLMALSIAPQPIMLALARRLLQEAVSIDQTDPETWQHLVESSVTFVRAGLIRTPEESQ